MEKIIVTGATGVVGTAVLERYAEKADTQITALTRGNAKTVTGNNIEWKQTDYSLADLQSCFDGVSAIIHLAGVKGDKTEPSDFDEDIEMTRNILDAAINCGVKRIIYSSSRLVYVNPDTVPWTEETAPEPASAYAVNKVRTENLLKEYSSKHAIKATVLRVAQVISKNDHMRNMVNVFRDLSASGQPLKVIGKSVAKRQYIYDRDLANIIVMMSQIDGPSFDVVNVGMTQSYTNYEIAEAFKRAYKNEAPIIYDDSVPETITASEMNVSKMLDLISYTPMDMDSALCDMASGA